MSNEPHGEYITSYLCESAEVMGGFANDATVKEHLAQIADAIVSSLRSGGKLMIAGNGGSAADAQHIAGEFVVRLMHDRAPLAAMAFSTDGSIITACGNDYGFEHVFERQLLGLGRPGDVFLAISTSGNSLNIIRALEAAHRKQIATVGFTGGDGGRMRALCDHILVAPSNKPALIQQIHITAAHVVCAIVERTMFPMPT